MKRRLHVAYICADRGVPLGGRKGASTHVHELAQALARRGAEVQVVAARVDEEWDAKGAPFEVIDLGRERAVRSMRQSLFAETTTPLQQARAAEAYGVLLNQSLGRALERLHRSWRIDALYERYSLWSFAGAGFAQAQGLPFLLEVNAPLRREQKRYRSLASDAMAASLEGYLFAAADHVLVPSAELRPYVMSRGGRKAAIRVLPNAADSSLFAGNAERATGSGETFVVGFVGTLKPWHGLNVLVRAFRRLHRSNPSYRLLIAGDGPLRPELEREVRRAGLRQAVEFAGEFEHHRVGEILSRMDVGTAPYPRSRDFYFSPLKLFEYMAAGVPVVASDIGQIGELLTDGRDALLHRPGSAEDLAACVERVRRKPEMARRIATAARRLAQRRFTWEGNAEKVLALAERARVKRTARG